MMPIVQVAEQRNRRLCLEAAIIFAAWAIFGLLLAHQSYIQAALAGRQMPWIVALRPGLLEAVLWALTTVAIFWLTRRFPLERGRMLQGIAVHLVAAVVIALARTGVMVVLGWYVPWVRQRTFGPQFWGTSSQNFLFYALLLGIAHLVLYYRRYREREQAAEQLAERDIQSRCRAGPGPYYGTRYGIVAGMAAERKLTVHIPADLLEKAQRASGQGITETIRQGLKLLAAGETYRQLSRMRGKVKFSIDLERLREDRG